MEPPSSTIQFCATSIPVSQLLSWLVALGSVLPQWEHNHEYVPQYHIYGGIAPHWVVTQVNPVFWASSLLFCVNLTLRRMLHFSALFPSRESGFSGDLLW